MSRLISLAALCALTTACATEVAVGELREDDTGAVDPGPEDTEATADTSVDDSDTADTAAVDTGTSDTGEEATTETVRFELPGEHAFTVPAGVHFLEVAAHGGGGAGGDQQGATGGGGAYAAARVPVSPGETLQVWVAEGGKAQGDGGGASWVLRADVPLLVAAGGGGGGSDGCSGCKVGGAGGAGGGVAGQHGQDLLVGFSGYCEAATGGRGATETAGGAGGLPFGTAEYRCAGEAGALGRGGEASGVWGTCETGGGAQGWRSGGGQGNGGGGAGGAGWYGGGGAGFIWTYCSGGGGGGSSASDPANTAVVLDGGMWQVEGWASTSGGAGRGGDVRAAGADGMVEITW